MLCSSIVQPYLKHGTAWKGGTKAVRCTKQLFQARAAMEERERERARGEETATYLTSSSDKKWTVYVAVGCSDVD